MRDGNLPRSDSEVPGLHAEIDRLNKVVEALMDRIESSYGMQGSEYDAFRTTILLEDQVKLRTEELKAVIEEKEELLQALWESEAKFRGIVNQPMAGICMIDEGKLIFANPKLAEIFGYSVGEIQDLPFFKTVDRCDQERVSSQLTRRINREVDEVDYIFRGVRKDGTLIDVECHGSVMVVGGKRVLLSLLRDVTDRIRSERAIQELQDQLRELAIRDPLTGLYNRLPLNEFFDREIRLAERHDKSLSIVFCDIDHFKLVNDNHGHLAGDELLKHFAEMIRSVFRSSDIFCRYGGEEFLILLPDTPSETALERAECLRETLQRNPATYCGSTISVSASLGIATYPRDGRSRCDLIAAADRALYAAKDEGRNRVRIAN